MASAKQILEHFRRYDRNGDGVIDKNEMSEVMAALDSSWTPDRVEKLFDGIDIDNDGVVETEEFVQWICGYNLQTAEVMVEKPLVMLRLQDFDSHSHGDLHAAFSRFGEVLQLHHAEGMNAESLVLFAEAAAARSAFEEHGGVVEGDGDNGCYSVYVEDNNGTKEKLLIKLTPKKLYEAGTDHHCPEEFCEEFVALIESLKQCLGEDYRKWRLKANYMGVQTSIGEGAKQLRLLSMTLSVKNDSKAACCQWRRTLRMISKGEIDIDPDRIVDYIREFKTYLGDCQEVHKRMTHATATTTTQKKKELTNTNDGWDMIASLKSNENSVLQHVLP